jgi:hypothetical protein
MEQKISKLELSKKEDHVEKTKKRSRTVRFRDENEVFELDRNPPFNEDLPSTDHECGKENPEEQSE